MTNKKIIGLTGPIASGKTLAAKVFKEKGAKIIDADDIGHELLKNKEIEEKIIKAFGEDILKKGQVDRKVLGQIVFSDPLKLHKLNSLLHPLIIEKIKAEVEKSSRKIIVIDAALPNLFEGITKEIWLVKSSNISRLMRLMKHGLSKDEALKRMNSQMSIKDYEKMAKKIIENDGEPKDLENEVSKIVESL
jgi:dephospho-CoA kinase